MDSQRKSGGGSRAAAHGAKEPMSRTMQKTPTRKEAQQSPRPKPKSVKEFLATNFGSSDDGGRRDGGSGGDGQVGSPRSTASMGSMCGYADDNRPPWQLGVGSGRVALRHGQVQRDGKVTCTMTRMRPSTRDEVDVVTAEVRNSTLLSNCDHATSSKPSKPHPQQRVGYEDRPAPVMRILKPSAVCPPPREDQEGGPSRTSLQSSTPPVDADRAPPISLVHPRRLSPKKEPGEALEPPLPRSSMNTAFPVNPSHSYSVHIEGLSQSSCSVHEGSSIANMSSASANGSSPVGLENDSPLHHSNSSCSPSTSTASRDPRPASPTLPPPGGPVTYAHRSNPPPSHSHRPQGKTLGIRMLNGGGGSRPAHRNTNGTANNNGSSSVEGRRQSGIRRESTVSSSTQPQDQRSRERQWGKAATKGKQPTEAARYGTGSKNERSKFHNHRHGWASHMYNPDGSLTLSGRQAVESLKMEVAGSD